jgi:signal transduction histidine kinase
MRAGWILAGWLLVGLLSIAPSYLHYLTEGAPVPWSRLWSEVVGWWLWLVLLPAVVWGARRFPIGRGTWSRSLPAHVALGAVITLAYTILALLKSQIVMAVGTRDLSFGFLQVLPGYLFGGFQVYFLVYCVIVAGVHALDYHRKYRERELAAVQHEAPLNPVEQRMQLNPHFLFNILNAIAALIYSDPQAAEQMIGQLSDFLRLLLRRSAEQELSLEEELDFLERYLTMEQTRFGDSLRVSLEVPPALLDARVPSLILQPLVENSIRHGMGNVTPSLDIRVAARLLPGGWLALEVRDNGPGPIPSRRPPSGVGIANTKGRLEQLYGEEHSFDLEPLREGGAVARIVIPYHAPGDEERVGGALLEEPAPLPEPGT